MKEQLIFSDNLLTVEQTAQRLGIKEPTVRLWIVQGRLPHVRVKIGHNKRDSIRIPGLAVDKLIEECTIRAIEDSKL